MPETKGIFGDIGLCLSGGGTRAAAFHFGTLAYLDRTGLISDVKMLSTVSGGTVMGAKYTLSLLEKQSFSEFFMETYKELRDIELIKLFLEYLAEGKTNVPSGRKDLIISAAQVYSDTFLSDHSGKPVLFGSILDTDIGLREIIFNTTEFKHGLDFRFQKSANPRAHIGNGKISIPKAEAMKIRLADIAAASSCIPAGFEPFAFPDDFAWSGNTVPPGIRKNIPEPLPLMDGGIYDNQGIESLILADDRSSEKLDLFVISDSTQESGDFYPFPDEKTKGGLTLGGVNIIALVLYAICALTAIVTGYQIFDNFRNDDYSFFKDFFLYLIPFILAGYTAAFLWFTRFVIRRNILSEIPQIGVAAWDDLKRLSVHQVEQMLKTRISSLIALSASIFMARIRRLVFGKVYNDKDYNGKRVSNLIYQLMANRPFPEILAKIPGIEKPSKALQKVVDVAENMGTKLWFDSDKPYELPCLASCGQATICFNLMKYVVRTYGSDSTTYPEEVRALWEQLVTDWNIMVNDPYKLLQELLPGIDLPKP